MGIPSATVRGFLRHARRHAAKIRMTATVVAHDMDRMLGPITPVPGLFGDLVEAIGVAVVAVIRRGLWPLPPDPAAVATVVTSGYLLPACVR